MLGISVERTWTTNDFKAVASTAGCMVSAHAKAEPKRTANTHTRAAEVRSWKRSQTQLAVAHARWSSSHRADLGKDQIWYCSPSHHHSPKCCGNLELSGASPGETHPQHCHPRPLGTRPPNCALLESLFSFKDLQGWSFRKCCDTSLASKCGNRCFGNNDQTTGYVL